MKIFRRQKPPAPAYPFGDEPVTSPPLRTAEEVAQALERVHGYLGLSRYRGSRILPSEFNDAVRIVNAAQDALNGGT